MHDQHMARLVVKSGAMEDKLQLELRRDLADRENKAVYDKSILRSWIDFGFLRVVCCTRMFTDS
jgi:hypothetical protein